ncbi:MAG: hypothetical protein ACP5D1_08780 [Bacteroidales bacterium]
MPAHEGAGKTGKTTLVFQPDASVNGWMAGRKIRGYHGFPSVWQPGSYAGGQVVKQTEKQGNIAFDP